MGTRPAARAAMRSEVDSESRRQPTVLIARSATDAPGTRPLRRRRCRRCRDQSGSARLDARRRVRVSASALTGRRPLRSERLVNRKARPTRTRVSAAARAEALKWYNEVVQRETGRVTERRRDSRNFLLTAAFHGGRVSEGTRTPDRLDHNQIEWVRLTHLFWVLHGLLALSSSQFCSR
jgi:hypothetical protein